MHAGWSHRGGRSVHAAVFASNLSMDFIHLSACAVTGAMLLVRLFNGTELVLPLGVLAAAICLLPDVRVCRWLLDDDPVASSRQLRDGTFLRDPVMLGALAACAIVCVIDRVSLMFLMISTGILQVTAILVMLDKYLPEIQSKRFTGLAKLFFEREARRLWICLAPLGLLPLRVLAGDSTAWIGAFVIAAAVVLPDLFRLFSAGARGVGTLFHVAPPPPPPATWIVLPKS